MQISFSKTNTHDAKSAEAKSRPGTSFPPEGSKRSPNWKPQPSGMTRDETREAVLEMIG